ANIRIAGVLGGVLTKPVEVQSPVLHLNHAVAVLIRNLYAARRHGRKLKLGTLSPLHRRGFIESLKLRLQGRSVGHRRPLRDVKRLPECTEMRVTKPWKSFELNAKDCLDNRRIRINGERTLV